MKLKLLFLRIAVLLAAVALVAATASSCGDEGPDPGEEEERDDRITTEFVGELRDFALAGSGTVTIKWGDGETEKVDLQPLVGGKMSNSHKIPHTYERTGRKNISITGSGKLTGVNTGGSGGVTAMRLEKQNRLQYLDCSGEDLSELDLDKNAGLQYLDCSGNTFEKLDLGKNTMLKHLNCSGNGLARLDMSKNPMLQYLDCSGNGLALLNIEGCEELEELNMGANELDIDELQIVFSDLPDRTGKTSGEIDITGHGTQLVALHAQDATDKNWNITPALPDDPDFYTPAVEVGEQSGVLIEGEAGTATFAVTTRNIAAGEYEAVIGNLPAGVTVAEEGKITIGDDGAATLTLAAGTLTRKNDYYLTLTVDGSTSDTFTLKIGGQKSIQVTWDPYHSMYMVSHQRSSWESFTVTTQSLSANSHNLNDITVSGLPAGVTLVQVFMPQNGVYENGLIFMSDTGVVPPVGQYTLTVEYDGVRSNQFILNIKPMPGISFGTQNKTLKYGGDATFTIPITMTNYNSGKIKLWRANWRSGLVMNDTEVEIRNGRGDLQLELTNYVNGGRILEPGTYSFKIDQIQFWHPDADNAYCPDMNSEYFDMPEFTVTIVP